MKRLFLILAVTLFGAGCATKGYYASSQQNPPPKEKFANFGQFELERVEVAPEFAGEGANQKAVAKIQQHLDAKLGGYINSWDQAEGRKLVIRPKVEKIKFIGGAARFWAGAMAGASAVYMRVAFVDAATGKQIAHPEFLQVGNAMGGAWSIGGSDNAMLERVADLIATYTATNYGRAVGGPTGASAKFVQ